MKNVTYLENNTVIGFDTDFSIDTVPNCLEDHRCMVQAAKVLRNAGVAIAIPQLTVAERSSAIATIIANKSNWSDDFKNFASVPTTEEVDARRAVYAGQRDPFTHQPVSIPNDSLLITEIQDEKDAKVATIQLTELERSSCYVTDLDSGDWDDWKTNFTVAEFVPVVLA